jgi:carbonic anhydrase
VIVSQWDMEATMNEQFDARLTSMNTTTTWRRRAVVVLGAMALAVTSAAAQTEFKYFGPNGPAFWGQLDPAWAACGRGHEQSPVDFGKRTLLTTLHRRPVPVDYERSTGQIFNNGHTIEVETEGHNVLTLGGVDYELQQFHFHGPSEHTFEGQGTDMELHLVHKSAAGVNAVVGVKVVRGPSSGALRQIFAQLPDDLDVPHPLAAPFNPRHFLPADREYYRYEGSLTTPPCSEGVHWLVLKDPITVSSEDLAQFHERIHFNARPVQRLSR